MAAKNKVKNGHGVSSSNNPRRTRKTKKRVATKKAMLAARTSNKRS